ncbi:MAG: methyltransferase domain-containing protein [Nocardioidaceae bacterium]
MFDVSGDAYGRFMGRFSEPLAVLLADLVGVEAGQRAVDVGCGPGALTAVLVDRLGAANVAACDPSKPFVAALRHRLPQVEVHEAPAEHLPFATDTFDAALAQLVVHFMSDPVTGLSEMRRVTRPGGLVAANVWDHSGSEGPLSLFWRAARDVDPNVHDEANLAGVQEGNLQQLFIEAGFADPHETKLTVAPRFDSFEDWWEPYTFGVGPSGAYVAGLDDEARQRVRDRCEELLAAPPFTITATAWTVSARA